MISAAEVRRHDAATIRRICLVPEPLTVTEWADKYRILPETSTAPGPYRSIIAPYVRRPQDLMGDPTVRRVVLCWAAQTLKSTCLENAAGYRIHRLPSPMVIVQPKIDAAEAWAKERFVPMVAATPVLRARVRLGRTSDSTLRYKRFPGGFLFVGSAQSATELASRSTPFVGSDEIDRYEILLGEGNPVEIIDRRMGAADIGLHAMTSTPRDAETTIIWPYLEGGTYELYEVPCPDCGHMQPLEWAQLRWERGHPETVRYQCRACEIPIQESNKPQMLADGSWVPQNPDASYPSFHLNGLYSPFAMSGWSALVGEWERAQGKPGDMQVFVNTRLAELWTETGEAADADSLLARLEPLEENIVPEGVGVLTFGADVQHNRIEAYVWGWGAGLESWLVAYGLFPGDPQKEPDTPGSVWRAVDEFYQQRFARAGGGEMRISFGLIDSGFATSQVYRYTRARRHVKLFAAKGVGDEGKTRGGEGVRIVGKASLQGKDRVILYPVAANEAKREFLRSQILERVVGPGYVHLPDWLTSDQCEQLVAEKRIRRVHRGRVSYEWTRKREDQPNEALDCRLYARAALEIPGAKLISRLATYAARTVSAPAPDPPPDTIDAMAAPQKRPARRSDYINSWRR